MVQTDNFDDLLGALRSTEPYIADDGFSSAVMAKLPEAKQLPVWLNNLIMLGFTAIGSAIAAWFLPVTKLVSLTTSSVSSMPTFSSLPVLAVAAVGTFLLSYVVIWMAQQDAI